MLYHGTVAPTVPVPTDILNFTDAAVYGQDQDTDTDLLTATGEAPSQYNEDFGNNANPNGPSAGIVSLSRVNGVDAIPFQLGNPTPGAANDLLGLDAIPEPSSLALVGFAAAAGLLLRRRR